MGGKSTSCSKTWSQPLPPPCWGSASIQGLRGTPVLGAAHPLLPPHLVGKAAPLQDACTATSSVIVFHFRSSSSASTTFLHLPAPRSVMPDRGSKWVGWVAHLVEASRLVLGWICEGLCRTMLQVIIDPPLQVVYAFYRSSTTPLSPLPTGSALVL
jgi:hypothetical protein